MGLQQEIKIRAGSRVKAYLINDLIDLLVSSIDLAFPVFYFVGDIFACIFVFFNGMRLWRGEGYGRKQAALFGFVLLLEALDPIPALNFITDLLPLSTLIWYGQTVFKGPMKLYTFSLPRALYKSFGAFGFQAYQIFDHIFFSPLHVMKDGLLSFFRIKSRFLLYIVEVIVTIMLTSLLIFTPILIILSYFGFAPGWLMYLIIAWPIYNTLFTLRCLVPIYGMDWYDTPERLAHDVSLYSKVADIATVGSQISYIATERRGEVQSEQSKRLQARLKQKQEQISRMTQEQKVGELKRIKDDIKKLRKLLEKTDDPAISAVLIYDFEELKYLARSISAS